MRWERMSRKRAVGADVGRVGGRKGREKAKDRRVKEGRRAS